jgi:trehalose 6-phosphate phosphatase
MKELPADLVRALDTAAATARLLVTSDFDGTLSPIVNNPADARPLPLAAEALAALGVLRELSGAPPTVHLVGSHGAEFDTGFAHDVDDALLARITAELNAIAADRPGVTVETKPASVALHVRNASASDGESAQRDARSASQSWNAHLTEGKAVLEFAVITTDKGEAIDILRDQSAATAVVFFGDDITDEKAFRRMRDADVGVKVGPGDTLARYRIDAPDDVAAALAYLLTARS